MNSRHYYLLLLTLSCCVAIRERASAFSKPAPARPQSEAKQFQLTIDSIMRGPDLTGEAPTAVRWSPDGQMIYFEWKKAGEEESSTYEVSRDGNNLRKLSKEEARQVPPAGGDVNRDRTLHVFARDGDLFLWRANTGSGLQNLHLKTEDLTPVVGRVTQLTKTREVESNPRFTSDGKKITFTRDNNLFLLDLSNATISQITDIRSGPEPKEPRLTDSQKFLQQQQKELFDVIRKQTEKEEKAKGEKPEEKPLYLQAKQSVQNLALSPGESYVSFTLLEPPAEARSTIVPSFVTKTGYTEDIPGRTKVGDAPVQNKMGIYHLKTQKVVWAGGKDELQKLAVTDVETRGRGDAAERGKETRRQGDTERKDNAEMSSRPRVPASPRRFFNPRWSEDGKYLATLAESTDNKTRWIYLVDPESGALTKLDMLHDDAWIGPLSMFYGWMPNNQSIYFLSEKTGYGQLYKANVATGQIARLTEGKFEVSDPQLSLDKKHIYFTSNEAHPGERHLYSIDLEGNHKQRLTFSAGNNRAEVSPDDRKLAVVYSYINRPPELFVQDNGDSREQSRKQITTSPLPEFFTYSWAVPEVITLPARDGALVYARLYRPQRANGAAVLFVHGAGYLQNAHRWWSMYSHEYMFHNFLMTRGYTVMDVDYRGSAGYGRDWRTAIYRHMGGKDLDDQVDAVHFLIERYHIDPARVGIYGGSYGGFITLMAMFTTPDTFAAGAALRPVTDWAHYNHGYTSNILNVPASDLEAYKKSSPIYFAEGLKHSLLICHGMIDTNVHFQDTVRLVQRLIELRKENWEVAVYPVEDHGFVRPTSWADEYKRIFKLFEENLNKQTPPAEPRPAGIGAPKSLNFRN